MEIIYGEITSIDEVGNVVIKAAFPDLDRALLRRYKTVEIGLTDGRKITPEQRRKAYAIMGEIKDWYGGTLDEVKELLKYDFMVNKLESIQQKLFSFSDTDETTARGFITYLIDFCIENDVPTKEPLTNLTEDIEKYVYMCLRFHKCAVCGRLGELHHVDRVGAGRDRTKINHLGMRALPLCRVHHTLAHDIGDRALCEKYHLEPVKIDKVIAKAYRLNTKG